MIKIKDYHSSNYCKVYLAIDPIRPRQNWEEEIALAIAAKYPTEYSVHSDRIFFKKETSVPCSMTIDELKKMQVEAQEKFSIKIQAMRKRLNDFKVLQNLIKKEEGKK